MNNLTIKHIKANAVTDEEFVQIYNVEQNSAGDPYSKEGLKEIVFYENNDNFLCYENELLVGEATLNPNSKRLGGSIYLINISVHKDYQRQGIASAMMTNIINYYKTTMPEKQLSLNVEKSNTKAFNLYKKFGFSVIESDDEDYLMAHPALDNENDKK